MLSRILGDTSVSSPYTYLMGLVIICVIVCITIIVVTSIIQWGRIIRVKILADKVSPEKGKDIVGKQLEEELGDRGENNSTEKVIGAIKGLSGNR